MTRAEKKRAYRRRQAANQIVVPVTIDVERVCSALLTSGALNEAETRDRTRLAQVLGEILNDWCGILLERGYRYPAK
jgi:hypothetical protein